MIAITKKNNAIRVPPIIQKITRGLSRLICNKLGLHVGSASKPGGQLHPYAASATCVVLLLLVGFSVGEEDGSSEGEGDGTGDGAVDGNCSVVGGEDGCSDGEGMGPVMVQWSGIPLSQSRAHLQTPQEYWGVLPTLHLLASKD